MASLKRIPGELEYDDDDNEVEVEVDNSMHATGDSMPMSFGRQDLLLDPDEVYEKARRMPAKEKKKPSDDSDDDSDDDDSDDDEDEFPVTHEVLIKAHSKPVSSISLDPSGTRFATGSHDYTMKFYDFPSMSPDHLHAFRSCEPSESHHVHSATFSHTGQSVLVVPAANQAKVFSRDGHEEFEFVKGDMYLRDMHNTKGHVAEITAGLWHPTDKNLCATASADSTIRIWDVNSRRKHKEIFVHKSKTGKGGRSRFCCLAWAGPLEGGKSMLASVVLDGTLTIFGAEGPFTRPVMEVRDAHTPDTWTGGIAFSGDGRLLVTRGMDQTIKLWDTRKIKTPVSTRTDFATPPQPESNLIFSPNSSNILTGDADGNLHILSAATLRSEETHAICPSVPIVSLAWSQKINQILLGTAAGNVHVLFSASSSSKGAKTILTNAPRKRHIDDDMSLITDAAAISGDAILTPNAVPRKRNADMRRPEMPQVTPWGKSQPDAEHIRKTHALSSMRDEDPREALLKYAEKAEKDPMFTGVWNKNQPKTIYAEVDETEEEEVPDKKKRRY